MAFHPGYLAQVRKYGTQRARWYGDNAINLAKINPRHPAPTSDQVRIENCWYWEELQEFMYWLSVNQFDGQAVNQRLHQYATGDNEYSSCFEKLLRFGCGAFNS